MPDPWIPYTAAGGKAGVELFSRKPLFLGRGGDVTVAEQARRSRENAEAPKILVAIELPH